MLFSSFFVYFDYFRPDISLSPDFALLPCQTIFLNQHSVYTILSTIISARAYLCL